MSIERYDLHCHSTASDGTKSPIELLHMAKEKNLTGISITDHDTVDAYTEETIHIAKKLEIQLIPGVEFSSHLGKEGIHVLGYFYEINSPVIKAFCQLHQKRREKRNQKILDLLAKQGIEIQKEELETLAKGTVGRPHFAKILYQKGYVKNEKEAFQKYLADGKSAYDPGNPIPLDETIDVIHRAGGLAFLAHPMLIRRKKAFESALLHHFDGIECFYARFPRDQIQPFVDIANERGLLKSGGSDYHGIPSSPVELGRSFITEKEMDKIRNQYGSDNE